MTLEDQTKLIEDLIKENPDTTIKDFLELAREIDKITEMATLVKLQTFLHGRVNRSKPDAFRGF
jgi:hypothetical protein